jgi:hypothetical protein
VDSTTSITPWPTSTMKPQERPSLYVIFISYLILYVHIW